MTELIADFYQPVDERDADFDFKSASGQRVLLVKHALQGARDLDAALMRLASVVASEPRVERSTLLARFPKMSSRRVRNAWESNRALLRQDLGQRLFLAAIAMDGDVTVPEGDLELRKIVALAREAEPAAEGGALHLPIPAATGAWSSKQFDVWMVLLDAWLRREEPLTIKDLLLKSGTSTATVRSALHRLSEHGELKRTTSRRAALSGFPRRSMNEILTLTEALRSTLRLVDASGRSPNVEDLLRRVQMQAPMNVALGGVHAAKHYMPTFDLEGSPRVDVSVPGFDSLDWVARVDPALRSARADERSASLVVHRVFRPHSGAEHASATRLFASPAETLLDLYDLRLTGQAQEFVDSLVRKGQT